MSSYQYKYLKYKAKYLNLKTIIEEAKKTYTNVEDNVKNKIEEAKKTYTNVKDNVQETTKIINNTQNQLAKKTVNNMSGLFQLFSPQPNDLNNP